MAHPTLTPPGVHPDRLRVLRDGAPHGSGPVVYWMQRSQRTRANPALAHARALAAELRRPLAVVGAMAPQGARATARAATFELQGWRDVRDGLADLGVGFAWATADPADVALAAAADAAVLVVDRGYLRVDVAQRARVAAAAPCPVVQVEGDVVVPVDVASPKAEYMARTLRPKLHRVFERYLDPVPDAPAALPWRGAPPSLGRFADAAVALDDVPALVASLGVDASVAPVDALYPGGERAAAARLDALVGWTLRGYADDRNQPHRARVSYLGMHLRCGQVSPVAVLQAVRAVGTTAGEADVASFVEELLVRRELAVNHVVRNPDYDRYEGLPAWARRTLEAHARDPRPATYDDATLEAAASDDPYWNAAMRQSTATGYQHNYMRMYWGKKVLEWSAAPEEAYARLLRWNDRYHLDGVDPNGYAGVGWVFGLHDRPWTERPVFGTVRSMTQGGLERKTDPDAYVRSVAAEVARLRDAP
jgi:deoxyribodipyrimidine photo-lyase